MDFNCFNCKSFTWDFNNLDDSQIHDLYCTFWSLSLTTQIIGFFKYSTWKSWNNYLKLYFVLFIKRRFKSVRYIHRCRLAAVGCLRGLKLEVRNKSKQSPTSEYRHLWKQNWSFLNWRIFTQLHCRWSKTTNCPFLPFL